MKHTFDAAALLAATLTLAACGDTDTSTIGVGSGPASGTCLEGTPDCDNTGILDDPQAEPSAGMCAPEVTDCDDTGILDSPEFDSTAAVLEAEALLGLTESQLALDDRDDVRIGRRGEEHMPLIEDYWLGRLTLELDINDMDEWIVPPDVTHRSDHSDPSSWRVRRGGSTSPTPSRRPAGRGSEHAMSSTIAGSTADDPRDAEFPAGLSAAVTAMMRAGQIPGLSLAVVDRERLRYASGWGVADPGTATLATAGSAYLWFSMSKPVTATAALRLADEDLLDLDRPVGHYLDGVAAPRERQPTVRDLLAHTAGLANPIPIRWARPAETKAPDPQSMLDRLLARRGVWRHPIGGPARYSNLGYLIAGQVIATVSGMPFETYVRQTVLEPAGMTATGYAYRPDTAVATGTVRTPRTLDPLLRRVIPAGIPGVRVGKLLTLNRFHVDGPAYGGLIGDVVDASRFLRLHLNDGELDGHRVLAAETTRRMRRLDRPGKPFDDALGWFRRPTDRAGDWLEYFGAGLGFWNVIRLYPDRGLGIAVMTNSTRSYDFEPLLERIAGEPWP